MCFWRYAQFNCTCLHTYGKTGRILNVFYDVQIFILDFAEFIGKYKQIQK